MSINSLSNKNAPNVVASASLQSNGATEVRKRKKWTMEMNIFIIREYFRITKLQDVVSTYRQIYRVSINDCLVKPALEKNFTVPLF
jgi:hypothetical protein